MLSSQKSVERLWIPLALFLFALLIRLMAAEGAAHGDELATILLEPTFNGIAFFTPFKVWASVSLDLVWLRLFPILLGCCSVVLLYLWLRTDRSLSFAIATSTLLATSPIAVEYTQQITLCYSSIFIKNI
jgi:hypothetical protein